MYWVAVLVSAFLIAMGWYGVYDATVHGNPGTNSMSFAGALGGLAAMIAGCAVAIVARIIQAAIFEAERSAASLWLAGKNSSGESPVPAVPGDPKPDPFAPPNYQS